MRWSRLPSLVLLAAVGCRNQPLAPLPPTFGNGLTLELTLARAALPVGQSDTLTVTLTNTNPDTVRLEVGGCPLLIYIQDAGGATVVPSGGNWYCIAIVQALVLPPGGRRAQSFPWDTRSFAPGVYLAHGTFSGGGLQLATSRTPIVLN